MFCFQFRAFLCSVLCSLSSTSGSPKGSNPLYKSLFGSVQSSECAFARVPSPLFCGDFVYSCALNILRAFLHTYFISCFAYSRQRFFRQKTAYFPVLFLEIMHICSVLSHNFGINQDEFCTFCGICTSSQTFSTRSAWLSRFIPPDSVLPSAQKKDLHRSGRSIQVLFSLSLYVLCSL